MRSRTFELATQRGALEELARIALEDSVHPLIVGAARKITNGCKSRDDDCELDAVYRWVRKNIRYVADPRDTDLFVHPHRLLQMATRGAGAGDCDDHASLIAALLTSIGWHCGLRAWGPNDNEYVHVYAVVGYPKKKPNEVLGMDTTEDQEVGWEPPGGANMTAWLP